jgi:hypothetical protein
MPPLGAKAPSYRQAGSILKDAGKRARRVIQPAQAGFQLLIAVGFEPTAAAWQTKIKLAQPKTSGQKNAADQIFSRIRFLLFHLNDGDGLHLEPSYISNGDIS